MTLSDLVDQASDLAADLHNKAALIERGKANLNLSGDADHSVIQAFTSLATAAAAMANALIMQSALTKQKADNDAIRATLKAKQ